MTLMMVAMAMEEMMVEVARRARIGVAIGFVMLPSPVSLEHWCF